MADTSTYVMANPNVNVRQGAGTEYPFIASSPWANNTEVVRSGSIVKDKDGTKWQYCKKKNALSQAGYIQNAYLVDR